MNYIENIFICLAAPVLVAILSVRGRPRKMMLFLLAGMSACLLSSYISTFLAAVHGADSMTASVEIAPMVEEIMKLVPVIFYLSVFEPGKVGQEGLTLMVATGFATLENVCYLVLNGADHVFSLLIRGFGTGTMHVASGAIIGIGLMYLWDHFYMRIAGIMGLLSLTITFHAIYNVLVSQKGPVAWVGYLIPVFTLILIRLIRNRNMPGPAPRDDMDIKDKTKAFYSI